MECGRNVERARQLVSDFLLETSIRSGLLPSSRDVHEIAADGAAQQACGMVKTYESINSLDNVADYKDDENVTFSSLASTDGRGCRESNKDQLTNHHPTEFRHSPRRRHDCHYCFSYWAVVVLVLLSILVLFICSHVREDGMKASSARAKSNRRPTMVPLVWNETTTVSGNVNATIYHATLEFCQRDTPYNASVYGYRLPGETTCGPAGVVIRIAPGRSYQLTLHNAASSNTTITNLHTHGLHLSGSGNADDVTRIVTPGKCLTYHWDVLPSTMGGTFWIHAHPAPPTLTKRQLDGGAVAMLIVEENESLLDHVQDPTDRMALQAWLKRELLLVAGVFVDPSSPDGTTKRVSANGRFPYDLPISLQIQSDEWYRLRILTFQSKGKRGAAPLRIAESCQVHVVAYDGVWRFQGPNPLQQHFFNATGASRVDVAIKCPRGQHAIQFGPDTETIATLETTTYSVRRRDESEASQRNTAVAATPFLSSTQQPWEPARPDYLQDLSDIHDNNIIDHETDIDFLNITLDKRTISGQSWDPDVPWMHVNYMSLQEWTIYGSARHPFHSHIFHLQTFGCQGHEDGQYYDTVSVATSPDDDDDHCVVRFRVMDYGERVVIHCHNAGHEDEGMMVWYQVDGGPLQDSTGRDQMMCPSM